MHFDRIIVVIIRSFRFGNLQRRGIFLPFVRDIKFVSFDPTSSDASNVRLSPFEWKFHQQMEKEKKKYRGTRTVSRIVKEHGILISVLVERKFSLPKASSKELILPYPLSASDNLFIESIIPGTICCFQFDEGFNLFKIDDRMIQAAKPSFHNDTSQSRSTSSDAGLSYAFRKLKKPIPSKLCLVLSFDNGDSYEKVITINEQNKRNILKILDLALDGSNSTFDRHMLDSLT